MTEIDLDALEATARAATSGAWEAGDVWVYTDPIYPDDRRLSNVLGMKFADEERAREEHARGLRNAEHIAAFDPPTVLALITRLREAEAVIESIDDLTTRHYLDTSAGRAIYEITGAYYKTTKTEGSER